VLQDREREVLHQEVLRERQDNGMQNVLRQYRAREV